jgi:hypothetical protein
MDPKKTSDQIQQQAVSYLSDFAGQSAPHKDVITGPRRDSDVLNSTMSKIDSGDCSVHDLARAYKHSPHSPPAVLLKYIAHRVNHLEDYHSSQKGHALDHAFMASIGAGSAHEHNHELTTRHLNEWLTTNPELLEGTLHNKQNIASLVHKSGMNVRKINGEHYVAMTRGLNTPVMQSEMSLASFADKENSGFGSTQHHVWMPLKDLWYGFPLSPRSAQGNVGHECEWLFSNDTQRYAAKAGDVKTSHFSTVSGHLDPELVALGGLEDDSAASLVEAGRANMAHVDQLHQLGILGPKTLVAAHRAAGELPPTLANHSSIPRHVALQKALQLADSRPEDTVLNSHALKAITNPNLTSEDLNTIVSLPAFPVSHSKLLHSAIAAIASHPSFNESVCNALVEKISAPNQNSPSLPQYFLPVIAKNANIPCLSLHKALIGGLDAGEECPWSPASAVAACFNTQEPGFESGSAPPAFNNAKNSERYLRALSEYFGKNPDEETPHNIYEAMLNGARLDDTTVGVLVDLARSGNPLTGTTTQQHDEILSEMCRWNPHLTPRQLMVLSALPSCVEGLLGREQFLPSAAQVNIAKDASPVTMSVLANREELAPEAAEVILKRLSTEGSGSFTVTAIAKNPRIPVPLIEKYANHDSSPDFANAIAHGLSRRGEVSAGIVLPEPPPGGLE